MTAQANVERMARQKEFAAAQLRLQFESDDAREAARKALKASLVEQHRMQAAHSTMNKQRVLAQLDKARGRPEELSALLLSSGVGGGGGAGGGRASPGARGASSAPTSPRPRRPGSAGAGRTPAGAATTPRRPRPATARPRIA